jgi:CRISPR-associated exonuclease Cas4
MMFYSEDDLLPLSGLSQIAFCERRWALLTLERQWEENIYTAEGELLHEQAHSSKIESRPGALIRRTLPLQSLRLGLSGQADVVEFLQTAPNEQGIPLPHRRGLWRICPIEYKRSRDRGGGRSYRIQLCAQALCLEEMLGGTVAEGAVFDGKRKRRDPVLFDAELRRCVETLSARMHELFSAGRTPPPVYEKKCEGCSMLPVCMPHALKSDRAQRYLQEAVERNLSEDSSCENC